MLNYLKNEANLTTTENGATTYMSTGSDCLDLFATAGALRHASEEEIISRFIRAYMENPDLAMKLLFFARDIRGGLGERRFFRIAFNWLSENNPDSVRKNIEYVAEYGRYDDLLSLLDTPCEKDMLSYIKEKFEADMTALEKGENISLLAKWLPSINASNKETVRAAKRIAGFFLISDSEYRKSLSSLRKKIHIIENNLREKDYTFDYEKQPSRAMFKYKKAFMRNDYERYNEFLNSVSEGNAKLNSENISPYELIDPYLGIFYSKNHRYSFVKNISEKEKKVLNATWNSLPDFGGSENAIAVVDTSGSMYGRANPKPASVALSLGMYFAERNKGAFANHFITFSEKPQLIEIKGKTFFEKLSYITTFSEVANTNIEAVFELILKTAVKNHLPQEQLPVKLVIISDMEFDYCAENASRTNFINARRKFEAWGYRLPNVIFWNVASRNRQQPVELNEQGVALVSGATPQIFSMVAGDDLSPYKIMTDTLLSERYAKISA